MDAANICDVFCVANAAANSDAERRHPSKCECFRAREANAQVSTMSR